jgi:hypothetical protein
MLYFHLLLYNYIANYILLLLFNYLIDIYLFKREYIIADAI